MAFAQFEHSDQLSSQKYQHSTILIMAVKGQAGILHSRTAQSFLVTNLFFSSQTPVLISLFTISASSSLMLGPNCFVFFTVADKDAKIPVCDSGLMNWLKALHYVPFVVVNEMSASFSSSLAPASASSLT